MIYLDNHQLKQIVNQALNEDVGKKDLTAALVVSKDKKAKAHIVTGENGIICGLKLAEMTFRSVDRNLVFEPLTCDGRKIKKGQVLARISGRASKILTAERVALNFLSMLSGISTRTHQFVKKAGNRSVKILDTRKTIPGLRHLEKYAVRMGGGFNHRMKLDEMILVKDNHLQTLKSKIGKAGLSEAIMRIKAKMTGETKIEVEVNNLQEFKQVIKAMPDIIMLDNMKVADVKKAVKIRNSFTPARLSHKPMLEVSGNITLDNIHKYARCNVEFISVGALTKNIDSLDISLDIL